MVVGRVPPKESNMFFALVISPKAQRSWVMGHQASNNVEHSISFLVHLLVFIGEMEQRSHYIFILWIIKSSIINLLNGLQYVVLTNMSFSLLSWNWCLILAVMFSLHFSSYGIHEQNPLQIISFQTTNFEILKLVGSLVSPCYKGFRVNHNSIWRGWHTNSTQKPYFECNCTWTLG